MNRYPLLVLSLCIIFTAPSCTLYRRITGKQKPVPAIDSIGLARDTIAIATDSAVVKIDTTLAPVVNPQQPALLSALLPLWSAETPWRTFNGKAKVHYEGKGEDHSLTANIRMEKDKRIWISAIGLGVFEVARILITPDTVQIIDRMHKEVRVLPFSQLSSLLPIRGDFASIQNLIIGDAMRTGQVPNMAKDTADELFLGFVSPDLTHTLQFSKSDTSLHFQAISAPETFLLCQYSDYANENGRHFATTRKLSMTDKGDQHSLSLEFNKAGFDEAIETPFSIPDKYERK
jgi:hypothetical protein